MAATKLTFTRFCTSFEAVPTLDPSPKLFDTKLLSHLRRIARVWNTDAANDELLTGQELRCVVDPQYGQPFLPSIDLINRDRAHASRRVLSRPWLADTIMKDLYALTVQKGSICHLITH